LAFQPIITCTVTAPIVWAPPASTVAGSLLGLRSSAFVPAYSLCFVLSVAVPIVCYSSFIWSCVLFVLFPIWLFLGFSGFFVQVCCCGSAGSSLSASLACCAFLALLLGGRSGCSSVCFLDAGTPYWRGPFVLCRASFLLCSFASSS
jgi:hypothetical protein